MQKIHFYKTCYSALEDPNNLGQIKQAQESLAARSAQITDKADSKVGFLHFQAIIAKKLEVGEGLS